MDRRSALGRLAVGGATVLGANAIVSQPAFAYTNPTVTGSPTVTVLKTGQDTASISISSVPVAGCPTSRSAPPPGPVLASLGWVVFKPGTGVVASGTGTTVTIPASVQNWRTDDLVRVTVVYRYQCVYSGGTTTACKRWFREFSSTGNGNSGASGGFTGSAPIGPTSVTCP